MNVLILKVVILFLFVGFGYSTVSCPPESIIKPCVCDSSAESITCKSTVHLASLFYNITKSGFSKSYDKFEYSGSSIKCDKSLPPHVFGDVTFKNILINQCAGLTNIDVFSLISLIDTVEVINFVQNSLSNPNPHEKDIFNALSMFLKLKTLGLYNNKLTSIPENAFHNYRGKLDQLTYIRLDSNQIKSIGSYAFYNAPNLQTLYLYNNPTDLIEDFAFATEKSETNLHIDTSGPNPSFNSSAFQPLSLAGINRPATIVVGGKRLKTLNQKAFSLYLLEHPKHIIQWEKYGNLSCNCEMFWIIAKRQIFEERFTGRPMYCDGFRNTVIWDMKEEDFGDCKSSNDFELKFDLVENKRYYYI